MFRKNNWKWVLIATLVASVLTVGATVVMAQTGEDNVSPRMGTLSVRMTRGEGGEGNDPYLAEALGITTDELQAAMDKVRQAMVDQLLEDGVINQEQADAMAENDRLGHFAGRGMPRFQGSANELDQGALMADALGMTTDDLEAAQRAAQKARVALAVLDGDITQEQADAMETHNALKDYLNPNKLIADKLGVSVEELGDQMAEMRESAIQQAVEDGVITQEQADSVLSGEGPGILGPGDFRGRGNFHEQAPGGFDGFRGHRFPRLPEVVSETE